MPNPIGIVIALVMLTAVLSTVERRFAARPQRWRRAGFATDLTYWFFTPFVTRPLTYVAVVIAVLVIAALINTPVLDPVRWSVRDQVARLESGSVRAAAFDFGYLQFQSGPHGRAALDQLAGLTGHPEAMAIRQEIDAVRSAQTYRAWRNAREGNPCPPRHFGSKRGC